MSKVKREPYVWVVELWNDAYNKAAPRWEPCSECCIYKAGALDMLRNWRNRCRFDKFRITKYVRASRKGPPLTER